MIRGPEIRTARKDSGLTQREVALELGVQPDTVSRWERNKEEIKGASFFNLGILLDDERRIAAIIAARPKRVRGRPFTKKQNRRN